MFAFRSCYSYQEPKPPNKEEEVFFPYVGAL